ncbi:MAG: cyclase [Pirellulaceae bacterium]|jgi:cyclase
MISIKSLAALSWMTVSPVLCVFSQSTSAADGSFCEPKSSDTVFSAMLTTADSLQCNDSGYWEAHFDDLMVFVFVPPGEFVLGADDGLQNEGPAHNVFLNGYWIEKYPVTVGQFREFVDNSGYLTDSERGWGAWQWDGRRADTLGAEADVWELRKDGRWNNIYFEHDDDHPVGSVSWNDANQYASWLSKKLGIEVVLPTEAQWEKSARGTDARVFPWGNALPDGRHANIADRHFALKYGSHARRPDMSIDDGYVETSPVNAYPSGRSPYGIYDLAGNLGEWVYDVFDRNAYRSGSTHNPTGPQAPLDVPDERIDRVNRGGSWVDWAGVDSDLTVQPEGGHSIRSSARTGDEQNSSDDHMGFRLAFDGARKATAREPNVDLPDLSGVTIAVRPAGRNVFMLEASGDVAGNIAVLTGHEGVLLVDDQFAELVPLVQEALAGLESGSLRYILNTHHHDDHSDGNARLSTDGALIIAHDVAQQRLQSKAPGQWPVISFSSQMTLYFNDEIVRMVSVPGGHTDNDVVIFFEKANVVHMGDLMNSGTSSFPTADLDAGGNALEILKNINYLIPMISDDAIVIPGHGPLSNKAELLVVREMLELTIEFVRVRKQRGVNLADIVAEGFPKQYESWGYGHMPASGWIEMIYNSLN